MDKLLERFLNYVSLDTQSKAGETGSQHGRPMEVIASAERAARRDGAYQCDLK